MSRVKDFFRYAREREAIRRRREAGRPIEEWTQDKIFQDFRFCNVHREDDRTTRWLREHVREPMRDDPRVAEAVMIFRWFNRVETCELLHRENLLVDWDQHRVRELLRDVRPLTTGAYIVISPTGLSKLEGIISMVERMLEMDVGERIRDQCETLEQACLLVEGVPFIGAFMAYEVVTDLRWTALLEGATDIMTWASAGPGAARGLERVFGSSSLNPKAHLTEAGQERMLGQMRELLAASRDPRLWPHQERPWEMREVEHTLCEFDKYERTRLLEGRPRQKFRGA